MVYWGCFVCSAISADNNFGPNYVQLFQFCSFAVGGCDCAPRQLKLESCECVEYDRDWSCSGVGGDFGDSSWTNNWHCSSQYLRHASFRVCFARDCVHQFKRCCFSGECGIQLLPCCYCNFVGRSIHCANGTDSNAGCVCFFQ